MSYFSSFFYVLGDILKVPDCHISSKWLKTYLVVLNHIEQFIVWFSRYSTTKFKLFANLSNFSSFFEVLADILGGPDCQIISKWVKTHFEPYLGPFCATGWNGIGFLAILKFSVFGSFWGRFRAPGTPNRSKGIENDPGPRLWPQQNTLGRFWLVDFEKVDFLRFF